MAGSPSLPASAASLCRGLKPGSGLCDEPPCFTETICRGHVDWLTSWNCRQNLQGDFKTYVDQACRAADEFVNIYYETMDKRRRALTRLYLDKATLVWNGNAVSGQEELNKFFEMLPSSEFQVNVLDCQPVHESRYLYCSL
ncbi:NTF2-related export protein 2 isoform X5 [Grus americana]|uniref:NTF2-related export protein 2 isoform X5 n=1 Tax=Grus americana TaxID=9117 RepID=UPI0024085503|nr:NTF2-related export protein 2 isoform X5 [Grus americana]